MGFKIAVMNGKKVSSEKELFPGMTIGRKKTDLIIDNGSVSSFHAVIDETTTGKLVIIDQNSKNGIKINGLSVQEAELKPGIDLQIGRVHCQIIETQVIPSPSGIEFDENLDLVDLAPESRPDWNELLEIFSQQSMADIKNKPVNNLAPLTPAIKLEFIKGLQAEVEWTLGYGPRSIGSRKHDLLILEPGAPDICFQLKPTTEGVSYSTSHPKKVLLNDSPTSEKILSNNDVITIANTKIRVSLIS